MLKCFKSTKPKGTKIRCYIISVAAEPDIRNDLKGSRVREYFSVSVRMVQASDRRNFVLESIRKCQERFNILLYQIKSEFSIVPTA